MSKEGFFFFFFFFFFEGTGYEKKVTGRSLRWCVACLGHVNCVCVCLCVCVCVSVCVCVCLDGIVFVCMTLDLPHCLSF